MKPKRIQRKRTKGWKVETDNPNGVVYVGRPSKWGNPFIVADWGAKMAVERFRAALMNPYSFGMSDEKREKIELMRDTIFDLRGKDLACWCPLDKPCHADVLLELANS